MKNYEIITDSGSDLPQEYAIKNNIIALPLKFYFGEEEYVNYLDFRDMSAKEYYNRLRKKEIPKTSQVNIDQFKNAYEEILKQEKDILVVTLSSSISGTYNSALIAKEEVLKNYPKRNICVVDSKGASLGVGIVVDRAVKLRESNTNLTDTYNELEEFVPHVANVFTIENLLYLKEGGRIGSITYRIGATLRIKPILSADEKGVIKLRTNTFGRKKSLNALIKRVVNTYDNKYGQEVFISHGDCLDDAIYVKEAIEEQLEIKVNLFNVMGPVTGTHGGPGIVAVFYPVENR